MMRLRMMMRQRLLARLHRALTQNCDAARGCGETPPPPTAGRCTKAQLALDPYLIFWSGFPDAEEGLAMLAVCFMGTHGPHVRCTYRAQALQVGVLRGLGAGGDVEPGAYLQ